MELAITKNKSEMERLEGVIQKNIGAFYEVGRALMEIKARGIPGHEKEIELYEKLTGGAA